MTIRDKLKATLESSGPMCDDYLSSSAAVKPRQSVNASCRKLEASEEILRQVDQCPQCKTSKIVNRLLIHNGNSSKVSLRNVRPKVSSVSNKKPWYWEGNVQAKIVSHLVSDGWRILGVADTATRKAGKDIVASKDGTELWVSVKGWPEKSPNAQARHWFAGAIFDLVLYRNLNPTVHLAIGLPAGYSTYQNLLPRIQWLRKHLPFEFILVSEEGGVEVLEAPTTGM